MNSGLAKIKKVAGKFKAKINQEVVASFFAVAIFLYVFYAVFFGFKLSEYELSEYMKPFKENCCGYDDAVNNAGADIKNLVKDSQVEEFKYYDELINETGYSKRENPFVEAF